ncbi:polyprenyl diphosphate synthase [Streptomyces sp. NPDC099050]|uniref:polyprenyl diphosphate synthase n=1 Tax=Streptomyces sp. NPDC099050 TaxID=3366100 RepID=UPI0038296759
MPYDTDSGPTGDLDLLPRPCRHPAVVEAAAGLPQHLAVILDGNRRWAQEQGRALTGGYQLGGEKVLDFLTWCRRAEIAFVTLWALSLNNLNRAAHEVTPILDSVVRAVEVLAEQELWRIRVIGLTDLLPPTVTRRLQQAVETTAAVTGPTVNIALAYNGRQELLDALQNLLSTPEGMEQARAGLTAEILGSHLYTGGQPDPELIIRTSGEQRLSGFMPWQSAHSELYFCERPWPEFQESDLLRALAFFATRTRRFGR